MSEVVQIVISYAAGALVLVGFLVTRRAVHRQGRDVRSFTRVWLAGWVGVFVVLPAAHVIGVLR
jgi:hypothetical protein